MKVNPSVLIETHSINSRGLILARLTSPAGRERELARLSSCSRCSASKTNAVLGRPIAISTSIVHGRCLEFPAILLPLIYGTLH